MNNEFQKLFEMVDTLKSSLEERDRLIIEKGQLASTAKVFMHSVFDKYRAAEKEIAELIEQAEHENEENKTAIIELTRKQLKARSGGEEFQESIKLDQLKADVSTYFLKLEAMEKLKNEICISVADQKQIDNYIRDGLRLGGMVYKESDKVQNLLSSLRGEAILNCQASIDLYIESRRSKEFLSDSYDEYKNMRKDERGL